MAPRLTASQDKRTARPMPLEMKEPLTDKTPEPKALTLKRSQRTLANSKPTTGKTGSEPLDPSCLSVSSASLVTASTSTAARNNATATAVEDNLAMPDPRSPLPCSRHKAQLPQDSNRFPK